MSLIVIVFYIAEFENSNKLNESKIQQLASLTERLKEITPIDQSVLTAKDSTKFLRLANWLTYPGVSVSYDRKIVASIFPGYDYKRVIDILKKKKYSDQFNQVVVSDYLSNYLQLDMGVTISVSSCIEVLKKLRADILIIGSSVTAQALPPGLISQSLADPSTKILQCSRPFWNIKNIKFLINQIHNLNIKIPMIILGVDASTYLKKTLNLSKLSTDRLNEQLLFGTDLKYNSYPLNFLFKLIQHQRKKTSVFFYEPSDKYVSNNFFLEDRIDGIALESLRTSRTQFFDNSYSYDYKNCSINEKTNFFNELIEIRSLLSKISVESIYIHVPQFSNAFPYEYEICSKNLLVSTIKAITANQNHHTFLSTIDFEVTDYQHKYKFEARELIYFDGIHLNYKGAVKLVNIHINALRVKYLKALEGKK